jgi:hypothetical protein
MAIKLSIGNAHSLAVGDLETDGVHRDPFDRLLVCQSRVEPMLLLTVDSQLRSYGATVIVLGWRVGLEASHASHGEPSWLRGAAHWAWYVLRWAGLMPPLRPSLKPMR